MKRFRCGDLVSGCSAVFEGSEDSVLEQVGVHARADHGMTEVPASLVEQVRGAMVSV